MVSGIMFFFSLVLLNYIYFLITTIAEMALFPPKDVGLLSLYLFTQDSPVWKKPYR